MIELNPVKSTLESVHLSEYTGILNTIPFPVAYISNELVIEFINKAYETWAFANVSEIKGQSILQVLGKDAYDNIVERINNEYLQKSPFETIVHTKRGLRHIEVHLNSDSARSNAGYTILIQDISDRKMPKAESRKKKNADRESKSQSLVQDLPSAIYTCNLEGVITFYNKAAADLWGREPEIGKGMWCGSWKIYKTDGSILPLDDCPMAVTLKTGKPVYGAEIILERPDGLRKNVLPNPRPIYDESGKIIGAVNLLIDITNLRKASQAVTESEERFRTMADHAPIAIWMTDEKDNYTYINQKWTELTRKKLAESSWSDMICDVHPDDRERIFTERNQALEKHLPFDIKYRNLDDSQEFITLRNTGSPRYNIENEFAGYIGILQDVTLQERAKSFLEREVRLRTEDLLARNEELRRSEERYHHMIAEVQDYAIILLDTEGNIQNWNKGAENIKGYKAEEIVGKNFRLFYTLEDRQRQLPEMLIQKAKNFGKALHEGTRVRKDGSTFWGNIVLTALHDDKDNVIGFSKVTRDLSEKKAAEDILRESAEHLKRKNEELERMNQELSAFAYVSSHDLQEPLRKIQTFTDRILDTEKENLSQKGQEYFKKIQNGALRMQNLIQDLLSYSRTNTSERNFELVDLNSIVREVKSEMKERLLEKQAVIESVALPSMKIVRFQFRQLITNILSNSLKFARQDVAPNIKIAAEIVKGDTIPNADPLKNYHHLSFSDNGIGFEPEYNSKIFEVFQRLHGKNEYSGTGIGLAICKKIAENHNGFITAEGFPNNGATFHIYIPG